MSSRMFAKAEGAGCEASFEDHARAVVVASRVEMADQPGSRWANKY
jgi:hypothetical protein